MAMSRQNVIKTKNLVALPVIAGEETILTAKTTPLLNSPVTGASNLETEFRLTINLDALWMPAKD